MWVRADLQVHSGFHDDGRISLEELVREYGAAGYDVIYLTPHADLIGEHWAELDRLCRALSNPEIKLFPGLEVAVKEDGGHLLAYGLEEISGLENQIYPGQVLADRVWGKGPIASVAVAHPFGRRAWNWAANPLDGSFGLEIMSGLQTDFDLGGRAIRLWRRKWKNGPRPSARTGSDWHGRITPLPAYSTYVRVPTGWLEMDWDRQKYFVDLALARGWTVVSKNGSLAVLSLRNRPPGSILCCPEPGEPLEFTLRFWPRLDGKYRLALILDDEVKTPVWEKRLKIGVRFSGPYLWVIQTRFPGGVHYYWLYGEGDDYLYTTPIVVYSGQQGTSPQARAERGATRRHRPRQGKQLPQLLFLGFADLF